MYNLPILLILCLIPFLQIGLSYYVSVQVVILMLLLSNRALATHLLTWKLIPRAFIAYGFLVSPMFYDGYTTSDLARSGREALSLFLISGTVGVKIDFTERQMRRIIRFMQVFAIIMLGLVTLQIIFLSQGQYFGLPQDWFVINRATLPDELDLIYTKIRPMGTFGEPSYVALVCFVFAFALSPFWDHHRRFKYIILTLALIIFLARAMSGMLAISILLSVLIVRSRGATIYSFFAIFAFSIALMLTMWLDLSAFNRVSDIFSGEDYSFNARIITPLQSLPQLLNLYPTGIPGKQLSDMAFIPEIYVIPGHVSHNGLLNFFVNYGYLGTLGLFLLFSTFRTSGNWFFLLVLMMQNGGFLAFDKCCLAMVGYIIHLASKSIMQKVEVRTGPMTNITTSR